MLVSRKQQGHSLQDTKKTQILTENKIHFIHSHTNIYWHLNGKFLSLLIEYRPFLHKLFQCLSIAINKLLIGLYVDTGGGRFPPFPPLSCFSILQLVFLR